MIGIDFENDLKTEIRRLSKEIGFKISTNAKLEKQLLDYLTVRMKLIDPKVRKVSISPDFKNQIKTHYKKREILEIIKISELGRNLNPFQSKRTLQSNFHDHLRNEWNIFHFHLSLEKGKKLQFVKQVNSLLFAYIDDTTIIFLGTETHKDGIFADTKWIEVLHDCFPEVIKQYRADTTKDVSPKLNSVDRQAIWNNGCTLGMTKIRDTIYYNPGIGRRTSGHGSITAKTCNNILRWIYELKKQFQIAKTEICESLQLNVETANFKIQFGAETLELIELTSGETFLVFPKIFNLKQ